MQFNPGSAGTSTNTGNFQVLPYGSVEISGGSQVFNQNGGTLATMDAVRMYGTTFNYQSGMIKGRPYLVGIHLNLGTAATSPSNLVLSGWDNHLTADVKAGHTVWLQGNSSNGDTVLFTDSFSNQGTLRLEALNGYASYLNTNGSTLTNAGAIVVSPGGGGGRSLTGSFTNTGMLTLDYGLAVQSGASYSNSGAISVNAAKTLTFDSAVSNSGNLSMGAGSQVTVNGSYTQTAGVTTLSPGTLTANAINLNGGVLQGAGDINGSVMNSSGTVLPGGNGTAWRLSIHGDYTQNAGGVLTVDIGGTKPVTQLDLLSITGNAFLGGTLNIDLIGGFVPSAGAKFEVISSNHDYRSFAAFTGLTYTAGKTFTVKYNANNVTLIA